jgi:integrase
MPSQLPSGNWRPRIRHPRTRKHINPAAILGGPSTYPTEHAARHAENEAMRLLRENARAGVTVGQFWTEWTTDPLWQRPGTGTNIHNRERTAKFAARYADVPVRAIGPDIVSEWLKGGTNKGTAPALRAFFNDSRRPEAGSLRPDNPFANLRLKVSRGRRDKQPPSQAALVEMIAAADELTPPTFAALLDVAAHTGMRPGELDALRRDRCDFQAEDILVDQQWNAKVRDFTLPKHDHIRTIAMTAPAKRRLLSLPAESVWAFPTLRGNHYRPSSRAHHWNRVRCAVGLGNVEMYLATRHYFGWYAWNVLGLEPHVIALQFGHRDGGELVRSTYGHPDAKIARQRIREAYEAAPSMPTPIRKAS